MCHALVFNIHHVVTHSTRVPLFLPSPIRADPSRSDGGRTAYEPRSDGAGRAGTSSACGEGGRGIM